ncbi:MAG: UDP-glucose 4-epimerase GalE [Defluviimonas sp.]|nr:UDP-glucose 4-epimerase GalE [Defluviimonas sp.]
MARHVLVTGGAGYIGSHACKALKAAGYVPVTFDSLVTGWEQAVKFGPFERGELADRARLDEVFARWQPVAVMHFAALSQVGEAMQQPGKYWRGNVAASLVLIEAAVAAGCLDFVFSSTCATYGDHDGVMLDEDTPQTPLNSYGASKRAIEDMLRDFGAAHGLRSVIFRYFNVAGADPEAEVGEFHRPETHLIPLMLDAIEGKRPALTVFGTDYPTPDGTCIRDYVHVMDLVDAHVLGLQWLEAGHTIRTGGSRVFCLGTGRGFSVREVIDHSRAVTNREVPIVLGERRAGDAVKLVSGSERAMAELGWRPQRSTLAQMIGDAWTWHQTGHYDR